MLGLSFFSSSQTLRNVTKHWRSVRRNKREEKGVREVERDDERGRKREGRWMGWRGMGEVGAGGERNEAGGDLQHFSEPEDKWGKHSKNLERLLKGGLACVLVTHQKEPQVSERKQVTASKRSEKKQTSKSLSSDKRSELWDHTHGSRLKAETTTLKKDKKPFYVQPRGSVPWQKNACLGKWTTVQRIFLLSVWNDLNLNGPRLLKNGDRDVVTLLCSCGHKHGSWCLRLSHFKTVFFSWDKLLSAGADTFCSTLHYFAGPPFTRSSKEYWVCALLQPPDVLSAHLRGF